MQFTIKIVNMLCSMHDGVREGMGQGTDVLVKNQA